MVIEWQRCGNDVLAKVRYRENALLKLLLVNDAVNWISKVLLQCREERCEGKQSKRKLKKAKSQGRRDLMHLNLVM